MRPQPGPARIALAVLLTAAGPASAGAPMSPVTTLPAFVAADGQIVEVDALYVEVDARMRPTGAPVLAGHVDLQLADGASLMLEPHWSEAARRPADERARFGGASVRVRGTARAVCPEPEIPVAARIGACLQGAVVVGPAGARPPAG